MSRRKPVAVENKGSETILFPLNSEQIRNTIEMVEPSNLDNFDNANSALHSVQMTREMKTSNGCYVTLVFPRRSRPDVRRRVAELFVAAAMKGMSDS